MVPWIRGVYCLRSRHTWNSFTLLVHNFDNDKFLVYTYAKNVRSINTNQQTNPFLEHCLDTNEPSSAHCGTYPLPSFSLTTSNSANIFCWVHIVTLCGKMQCLPHSPPSQHFCIDGHSKSWAHGVPQSNSLVIGTGHVPAFWSSSDAGQHTP